MLEKNRLGAALRVYFRPEFKNGPHCESKLRRTHTAWEKRLSQETESSMHGAWLMLVKIQTVHTQALRINLLKLRCLA
ncbi:hypothetical protein A3842_10420 [Paenibacillus sp. P3E]|nr:hypothetical protein A3842_10420 [Paenibacillus sp. P3E]OKP84587.1 hypothetical protein A3848_25325 [Paenibacillus sp. P32E]